MDGTFGTDKMCFCLDERERLATIMAPCCGLGMLLCGGGISLFYFVYKTEDGRLELRSWVELTVVTALILVLIMTGTVALVYIRRHRRNKAFFEGLVHSLLPEKDFSGISQVKG